MKAITPGVVAAVLAIHLIASPACPEPLAPIARNVILFIGDGMGLEQVRAAGLYLNGSERSLSFEQLPHTATAITDSTESNAPTDSAAAATAIATGRKVANNVVALQIPGSGEPLTTIAEHFRAAGRPYGIVTTDNLCGATPASFFAHVPLRKMYDKIGEQMLTAAKPDVMLGAIGSDLTHDRAIVAGYIVAADATSLGGAAVEAIAADKPLAGLFRSDRFTYTHHDDDPDAPHYGRRYPTLATMTDQAMRVLEARAGERGFFLMVENALIDKSGHNDRIAIAKDDRISCNIKETIALHEAVAAALRWADGRDDTLILVTADHETGGLKIVEPRGKGNVPKVTWAHAAHTRTPVGVYATGPGADAVKGQMDNTDIFHVMMRAAGLEAAPTPAASAP